MRQRPVALVAGGAGFIGSHLCDRLLARNFRVVCVDNLVTGTTQNIAHLLRRPGFRFRKLDICDRIPDIAGVTVVFNLASPASPKDYLALPLETLRVGADGTRNLLDFALRRNARFIMASTSEVYGDPERHPQKESYWGHVNPVGVRSVYDEAKRYAEALVMAYHRKFGLRTAIARIFNTYGPRMKLDDGRVVPNLIYQALTGRPMTVYGNGRQTRSFCYITDMVEGLLRMMSLDDPMPVNLGNPREFTIRQFARLVKELTGSSSRIVYEPLPEDDPRQRRPDISRARTLLHWKPRIPLRTGLRSTIEWFKGITARRADE